MNWIRLILFSRTMHESLLDLFGRVIRSRREATGMSQEELGEKTVLSRNYIGMIERGETNVTLLVIQSLAAALGTTMSALIQSLETDFDSSPPR